MVLGAGFDTSNAPNNVVSFRETDSANVSVGPWTVTAVTATALTVVAPPAAFAGTYVVQINGQIYSNVTFT